MSKKPRWVCPICGNGITEGATPFFYTPVCANRRHRPKQMKKEAK